MTRKRVNLLSWALIAAVTATCFVLDHFRVLHLQFNWFMGILLAISILLVATVAKLERTVTEAGERGTEHPSSKD